jgi:hypothetical protein
VVRSVQKALAVPSFFLDTKLSTVHDAKGSVGVMIEATTLLVAFITATKGVSSPDELAALFPLLGQKPPNSM